MNKKLIIGIIVVIALGFGGWKIWTHNSSTKETKEEQVSTSTNLTEKEDNDNTTNKNSSLNENDNDNESIISEGDTEDKKSSQNSDYNNEISQVSSSNISLPYKVGTTELEITKIQKYSGKFVEDGSNKEVSNLLALTVKNTSNKDLQYGQIMLTTNNGEEAVFNITNLPSKSSVLVLESSGSISYTKDLKYKDSTYGSVDNLPMDTKKVKVSTQDNSIGIENISGEDLGTVYVYYKNKKDGSYLGGITYRAKFEDVKKDDILTTKTNHFSEINSEIVMVQTEK